MAIQFDERKIFVAIILSFLALQLFSFLLSKTAGIPLVKGGWILILFLVVISIICLYTLQQQIALRSLTLSNTIFIVLVFAAVLFLMFYLPKLIPQIFSIKFDGGTFAIGAP